MQQQLLVLFLLKRNLTVILLDRKQNFTTILFYLGYWIWSFQGKILKRVNLDKFAQLLWRPRPPTLLSPEKLKEIKKNLKSYYPQFESKDRMRQSKASKELIEKRAALMDKFSEYRNKRLEEWNSQKSRRLALRNSKVFMNVYVIVFNNSSYRY